MNTENTREEAMDYELTEAMEAAKKEIIAERGLSEEAVELLFRKITYNFLKM